MDDIIELNVDAVYHGYHVSFTYKSRKYVMHTANGNRGKMVIRLLSINLDMHTYNWKYTHKDDVFTSDYNTIEFDDDNVIDISEFKSIL